MLEFCKTLTGPGLGCLQQFRIVELEASTTMRELKHRLSEQLDNITPKQLRITYKGRFFLDDETMPGCVGRCSVSCCCTPEEGALGLTVVMLSDPLPDPAPSASGPATTSTFPAQEPAPVVYATPDTVRANP
jgi:hypothetical protein